MTFVWTANADALLTRVWLQYTKRGQTEQKLKNIFDKIRDTMVVESIQDKNESIYVPDEEILTRLADLPDCPQLKTEVSKIDWYCKIQNSGQELTLHDYMIQFWENETQSRINEDLGVKLVPDWSKFYKNVFLYVSVNGIDKSELSDPLIPWAHTCQERIESIRKGLRSSPGTDRKLSTPSESPKVKTLSPREKGSPNSIRNQSSPKRESRSFSTKQKVPKKGTSPPQRNSLPLDPNPDEPRKSSSLKPGSRAELKTSPKSARKNSASKQGKTENPDSISPPSSPNVLRESQDNKKVKAGHKKVDLSTSPKSSLWSSVSSTSDAIGNAISYIKDKSPLLSSRGPKQKSVPEEPYCGELSHNSSSNDPQLDPKRHSSDYDEAGSEEQSV